MNLTDNELRSLVLQKYYAKRREPEFQWKTEDFADVDPAIEFDQTDLYRICDQLADADLIEWHPLQGHDGRTIGGFGKIARHGVDVVEGKVESPIPVHIDQSRHFNVANAHHNIFGDRNVQVSDVTIGEIARTITEADASKQQKDEARSVLKRAFEHPVVNTLVGAAAQVAAKALTGA